MGVIKMKFYTVRDLQKNSKSVWEDLNKQGEALITNNGKPTALMINITEDNFETVLREIKKIQVKLSVKRMRNTAAEDGYMSDEEINEEIALARKERKSQKRGFACL